MDEEVLIVLIIIGGVLMIALSFFIAKQFEDIAAKKGFNERKFFWIPFLLGLAGWIMVAALPDRGTQKVETADSGGSSKPVFKKLSIADGSSVPQSGAERLSSTNIKF